MPKTPALSDEELSETLDLLSTVLASVSDRVDTQTQAMDRLVKTASEARQAAFAARHQTDPERYGEIISETLNHRLGDCLTGLVRVGELLNRQTQTTIGALEKAEANKYAILKTVREREEKAEELKRRLPWFGLGAVVVALVLAVALPRFSALNGTACTVLGGQWLTATSGNLACVYYQQ